MDSTHFVSNIAHLTRLGLFCETLRVFPEEGSRAYPERYAGISAALRSRYIKQDGAATGYADARSSEAVRRLSVCGREAAAPDPATLTAGDFDIDLSTLRHKWVYEIN